MLVLVYILSKLQNMNVNIGLYRDNGLGESSLNPRQLGLAKKIIKTIKDLGLTTIMEPAGQEVDFLDVKLNFNIGEFKPFAKPNNKLSYVNTKSNHPPMVIKNIPKGIATRLATISANENIFNEQKKPYLEALKDAGHNKDLVYGKEVANKIRSEAEEQKNGNRE